MTDNIKISTRHNVAVDQNYFWNMDMKSCPIGTKVQLYGKGGLPQYGYYDGKNPFWVGWAPLPKVKTDERAVVEHTCDSRQPEHHAARRKAITQAKTDIEWEEIDNDCSLFQAQLIGLMEGEGASDDHKDVLKELAKLPLSPGALKLFHAAIVYSLVDAMQVMKAASRSPGFSLSFTSVKFTLPA